MDQLQQQQQAQINHLAQQIHLLEQQLAQAQQNNQHPQIIVPAPVVNNISSGSNKLKPAKPNTYDGKRKNDVDTWLNEMVRYFKACGIANYISDLSCVPFAVSQLRGDASVWWDSHKQQVHEDHEQLVEYWPEFEQSIQQQFQASNKVQDARDQLARLKQIQSVKAYTAEFIRLSIKIDDLGNVEKLDRYVRGLKPNVCFEVRRTKPQTFGDAVNVAEAYDNLMWSTKQLGTSKGKPRFLDRSDRDTVPMELCNTEQDAVETDNEEEQQVNVVQMYEKAKKLNISASEYKRRLEKNLCLKCAKPGHRINQCKFYKPTSSTVPANSKN